MKSNDYFKILHNACLEGNLEIVKKYIDNVNINKNNDLFLTCCYFNHVSTLKFLLKYAESIHSPINIHLRDEHVFRSSCESGQLDMVKFLLDYGVAINSPINIHAKEEIVFRYSNVATKKYLTKYSLLTHNAVNIHILNTNEKKEIEKYLLEALFCSVFVTLKTEIVKYIFREKLYKMFL